MTKMRLGPLTNTSPVSAETGAFVNTPSCSFIKMHEEICVFCTQDYREVTFY